MTQACRPGFDEMLLTGYVDGELTQADSQRVRLHLEECRRCRSLVEDLSAIREAARTTPFRTPTDEEWSERPRSVGSRWLRWAGWMMVTVWILGVGTLAVWGFLEDAGPWYEKLLVIFLAGGAALLLVSVLLDRLKSLETDRYKGVEK